MTKLSYGFFYNLGRCTGVTPLLDNNNVFKVPNEKKIEIE